MSKSDDPYHDRLLCAGILTSLAKGSLLCPRCKNALTQIAIGMISGNARVLENLSEVVEGAKLAEADPRLKKLWDVEKGN